MQPACSKCGARIEIPHGDSMCLGCYRENMWSKLRSNNSVKAMGERIISNELAAEGWRVVNANAGEENFPNLDLIALRGDILAKIQVKSSKATSHPYGFRMGGFNTYYKNGDENGYFFNSKEGPQANILISVYIKSPKEYRYIALPIKKAEERARKSGEKWYETPKRDGNTRSPKFPVIIQEKEYGGGNFFGYPVDTLRALDELS